MKYAVNAETVDIKPLRKLGFQLDRLRVSDSFLERSIIHVTPAFFIKVLICTGIFKIKNGVWLTAFFCNYEK